MPPSPQAIYDRLVSLPRRRSLDAALELLDALGCWCDEGTDQEKRRFVQALNPA